LATPKGSIAKQRNSTTARAVAQDFQLVLGVFPDVYASPVPSVVQPYPNACESQGQKVSMWAADDMVQYAPIYLGAAKSPAARQFVIVIAARSTPSSSRAKQTR
jgi:hypothetical protein